jgi:hypothetical protein
MEPAGSRRLSLTSSSALRCRSPIWPWPSRSQPSFLGRIGFRSPARGVHLCACFGDRRRHGWYADHDEDCPERSPRRCRHRSSVAAESTLLPKSVHSKPAGNPSRVRTAVASETRLWAGPATAANPAARFTAAPKRRSSRSSAWPVCTPIWTRIGASPQSSSPS